MKAFTSQSALRNLVFALKAHREGSQTCNVWDQVFVFCALKERQKKRSAASSTREICGDLYQTLHVWLPSRCRLRGDANF